ncbi:hypothetical protein GCWU000341_01957 [Oribacterium sp. oral taxon 078 str. F0262]|nr:hypothetical protein GCWU000341_01957 [Oribacterium sp. oral taxon 078 str. F0262]
MCLPGRYHCLKLIRSSLRLRDAEERVRRPDFSQDPARLCCVAAPAVLSLFAFPWSFAPLHAHKGARHKVLPPPSRRRDAEERLLTLGSL